MKAIIIAAGFGSRLKEMTTDKPKCMLEFAGKSLLNIQLDTFRSCGINDISVVVGYQKDKINVADVCYFNNDDYPNNNILESLFCAEEKIQGDVIITYCDILFHPTVVETLLKSKDDISIVVDQNWQLAYQNRKDHPLSEAENVIFDEHHKVQKIGKIMDAQKLEIPGEFIGMLKLNAPGATKLKEAYHSARKQYLGKPFQKANSFKRAYITDILQHMVDCGTDINCTLIDNDWREIDTQEDFYNANNILQQLGIGT